MGLKAVIESWIESMVERKVANTAGAKPVCTGWPTPENLCGTDEG